MTGYSFLEDIDEGLYVSVELRALNNRFLEIHSKLPQKLLLYENEIREVIKEKVKRGKVELSISTKEMEEMFDVNVNVKMAEAYYDAYVNLIHSLNLQESVRLSHIIKTEGIIISEEKREQEETWNIVKKLLSKAVTRLHDTKKTEGHDTQKNILNILSNIEKSVEEIKKLIPKQIEEFSKKLKKKMDELLGEQYDEQRIAMEIGILSSKVDINEEIERLSNHTNQFREACEKGGQVGKHLDFISQEMMRESNTIGSKTNLIEISNLVINLKTEIEKIKEQIRNVE